MELEIFSRMTRESQPTAHYFAKKQQWGQFTEKLELGARNATHCADDLRNALLIEENGDSGELSLIIGGTLVF
jgi:hypothetical protein